MQTKYFVLALISLSFLLSSCDRPKTSRPLPEVVSNTEEGGFCDLTFSIRDYQSKADGSQELHAYGLHQGREVGLIITLGAQWTKGTIDVGFPLVTHRGIVTFHSVGAQSDLLLQVLDQLYSTKLNPSSMQAVTSFTGISLEGKPADLTEGDVKIKTFHESEDQERYAEFYTNINLSKGLLEIHEKDPEYRAAIIKALRKEEK
jgi:hypothetical protein